MKVLPHPKEVTTQTQQLELLKCDNCSPETQNVWGWSKRQLIEGGRWNPENKCTPHTNTDGSRRWKQKTIKYYEGWEETEPEFNISNQEVTGEIVRFLWRSGRCESCIRLIFSDTQYKGCSYGKWNPQFLDLTITAVDSTDEKSFYFAQMLVPSNSVIDSFWPKNESITLLQKDEIDPRVVQRILSWIQMHPDAPQKDISAARLVNWTNAQANDSNTRRYLKHMVEQGMLSFEMKKFPGKKGPASKVHTVLVQAEAAVEFESPVLTQEECFALMNI